jgi:hypothetical protein
MRRILAFSAALAAAACAEPPRQAEPPFDAHAMAVAPGGVWQVVAVFPPGRDMLVGQQVTLGPKEVTDPLGRTCTAPTWTRGVTTVGAFVGSRDPALSRMLPVIEAACDGVPFATYALWPDGSLMTKAEGFSLRLERAEAVPPPPSPPPPVAVAPPPAAEPPPPPAQAEEQPGKDLVYLASYGSKAAAEKGWRLLSAKSKALAKAHAHTKPVEVKGKAFVRLFAKDGDAKAICAEVKGELPACGKEP